MTIKDIREINCEDIELLLDGKTKAKKNKPEKKFTFEDLENIDSDGILSQEEVDQILEIFKYFLFKKFGIPIRVEKKEREKYDELQEDIDKLLKIDEEDLSLKLNDCIRCPLKATTYEEYMENSNESIKESCKNLVRILLKQLNRIEMI